MNDRGPESLSVRLLLNTDPAEKWGSPLRPPPLGQVQNSQRTLKHVAPKRPTLRKTSLGRIANIAVIEQTDSPFPLIHIHQTDLLSREW
ncbi:hypothetical protein [Baia soyae]|uniref:hypothetical protein n=1 Tax=Baia soyae TaxID=1544746 RepID=UPI00104F50E2|nr:hypothetical protein [Baia soyae]